MKKFFKIFFISLFVLVILLISVPYLFKGKILETANKAISENVEANVSIGNLGLSFLTNFPQLSIELRDLTISGKDEFATDTLLMVKSFGLSINPFKALKKNVDIKRIWIDAPVINAIMLEDSLANWDIAPADTSEPVAVEAPQPAEEPAGMPDFNMKLKSFEINEANIYYTDYAGNMSASLEDFNFNLKGDFSKDFSNLQVTTNINNINVMMDGIKYVRNSFLNLILTIDANLKDNIFTLQQNSLEINKIKLAWEGTFAMPEDKPMEIDLRFQTSQTDFKDLLSMVPSIFMEGYENLKVGGSFKIEGDVNGKYGDDIMPNANIALTVDNSSFSYPDLPKSVNNINIDLQVNYNGVYNDSTVVDLNNFHLEIAENPVDLSFTLKTPFSDPTINALFKANMDLGSFKDAIPLENTTIAGIVDLNLDMFGSVSMIENEQYEQFKADGNLNVSDFLYTSSDLPDQFELSNLECYFSPRFLTIDYLDAKMGESDFQFKGKLENYVPYALNDGILLGNFVFTSNYINVNQFMGSDEDSATDIEQAVGTEGTDTPTEETALNDTIPAEGIIEIPKNLHVKLHTKLEKVLYDDISISDINGIITVKDGVAYLDELNLKLLEGEITMDGEYNTKDIQNPLFDMNLAINEIDIPLAFKTFDVIKSYVPIAQHANGKFSANLSLASFLNQDMSPVMNSLTGEGGVSSKNIQIEETKVLKGINSALKTDKFSNISVKDFKANFQIRNNRLSVEPFDIQVGKIDMNISGDQGLDQTLNYTANVEMPAGALGSAAVSGINSLASAAGLKLDENTKINLVLLIGGTFSDPKITPKFSGGQSPVQSVKESVTKEIKQEVEKQKENIKALANEEADKIIAEAEKRAEQIKNEANKLAEQTRKEADASADKVIKQAGNNPIAKKAAQVSAEKIREEGYKKANQIENEADKQATSVVNKAKEEAEKLK